MTRARAVKAAMERLRGTQPFPTGDTESELKRAFDEGRIYGMQDAASVVRWSGEHGSHVTEDCDTCSLVRKIRALARKARKP